MAQDLPWEGSDRAAPHAGDIRRADVPTCRLNDTRGEIRRRVRSMGWAICVVVNDQNVVLGLLEGEALNGDAAVLAETIMACAPRTYRPHTELTKILRHLDNAERDHVLVTTGDGELLGIVCREDVENA